MAITGIQPVSPIGRGGLSRQRVNVPDQKAGHVLLHLEGGAGGTVGGTTSAIDFYFPIRPEDFQVTSPARSNVVQTLGAAYQEHWGLGVQQLTLRGHTGWREHRIQGGNQNNRQTAGNGYEAFKKLRGIHEEYNRRAGTADDPNTVKLELTIAIPAGFGMYRISSDVFRTMRNTQRPLLFQYEMTCTVLKDMTSADVRTTGRANTATQLQQDSDTSSSVSRDQINTSLSLFPPDFLQYSTATDETLQTIAQGIFGDASLAHVLQVVNGLSSITASLPAGLTLDIPTEI